jgi:hypothetical protein
MQWIVSPSKMTDETHRLSTPIGDIHVYMSGDRPSWVYLPVKVNDNQIANVPPEITTIEAARLWVINLMLSVLTEAVTKLIALVPEVVANCDGCGQALP